MLPRMGKCSQPLPNKGKCYLSLAIIPLRHITLANLTYGQQTLPKVHQCWHIPPELQKIRTVLRDAIYLKHQFLREESTTDVAHIRFCLSFLCALHNHCIFTLLLQVCLSLKASKSPLKLANHT